MRTNYLRKLFPGPDGGLPTVSSQLIFIECGIKIVVEKYSFCMIDLSVIFLDLDPHRGHMACLPPSTGNETPVEKDASSEARKAMALATSSASPGRPRAWVSLLRSRN